jgi:MFS family permease
MPQLPDIELGRVGSTSFLVLNAVGALLPAFVLMPVAHRIGRIKTHVICLACMTAGYLGLYWYGHSPLQVYAFMAVAGIGWAAIVSLPFAIVSQKVSQARMGLYMGLFNLSVVLPQLVVSLGVALIISRAPDKNIIFAISAASLALSTLAWSFVREDA